MFCDADTYNIHCCLTEKKTTQMKPQGSAGDRFPSSFLDSVTELLFVVSLPLLLIYKILHLMEVLQIF